MNYYLKAEILKKEEIISPTNNSYFRVLIKIFSGYEDQNGTVHGLQKLETVFAPKNIGDTIEVATGRIELIPIRDSKSRNGKRYKWMTAAA